MIAAVSVRVWRDSGSVAGYNSCTVVKSDVLWSMLDAIDHAYADR
jgi:hypothetical protein